MALKILRLVIVLTGVAVYGQEKAVVSQKKPPLPELFVRAQAQAPEIGAYTLRQLTRTGKIPEARLPELRREISEQLLSGAAPWYPRYPASGDIPNGLSFMFSPGLYRGSNKS